MTATTLVALGVNLHLQAAYCSLIWVNEVEHHLSKLSHCLVPVCSQWDLMWQPPEGDWQGSGHNPWEKTWVILDKMETV